MLVLAFAAGWLTRDLDLTFADRSPVSASREAPAQDGTQDGARDGCAPVESTSNAEASPEEVAGERIEGLPRFPSSIRTDYEQSVEDGLLFTETKFLADARTQDVRDFYREAFDAGGWTVADTEYSGEDWGYFVLSGEREALVEIEPREGPGEEFVEIEFELSEPAGEPTGEQASRGNM